ncbi:hypothetical protein ACFC6L_21430 [Kitasatospora phosalacinea]|uniref:hypothetical protein n=1 Tax=Kitasatospora phosalacinea TaxID=2065 RepID=UPI0035D81CD8
MDQLTAELLMTLAGGAAGAVGQSAWQSIVALVRRPAGGVVGRDGTGLPELEAFEVDPGDPVRARRLADVLTVRAEREPEFARRLAGCLSASGGVRIDGSNSVSGGEQNVVVQAQYIGTIDNIGGSGGRGSAG